MGPLTRSQISAADMQLSSLDGTPLAQSADYSSLERDVPSPPHSNNVGESTNTASEVRDSVSQPPLPASLELDVNEDRSEHDESSTRRLPRHATARQCQLIKDLIEEDLL